MKAVTWRYWKIESTVTGCDHSFPEPKVPEIHRGLFASPFVILEVWFTKGKGQTKIVNQHQDMPRTVPPLTSPPSPSAVNQARVVMRMEVLCRDPRGRGEEIVIEDGASFTWGGRGLTQTVRSPKSQGHVEAAVLEKEDSRAKG